MKTFYFTGTGNSLSVAKSIGGELLSIPQLLKEEPQLFEDDAIGFIIPCYCFGTPRIVKQFLEKNEFKANYIYGIMTYGNMACSGLKQLTDILNSKGIHPSYINQIAMVDNYLPFFEINDQIYNQHKKNIDSNIAKISDDINSRRFKYKKFNAISNWFTNMASWFNEIFLLDKTQNKFSINEKCISCGICAKVCPTNNIKINKIPIYSSICESCLSCIHNCPKNAISIKGEKSEVRFRNPCIKLQEIIDSNNQNL